MRACGSDVTTAQTSNLTVPSSWNGAHTSVTNGVGIASVGGPRATDTSWNIPEVQRASDSVCGRRTACVRTVPAPHHANVSASDVMNMSAPGLRPPLPVNAHNHRNNFLDCHNQVNLTNIVPTMPAYSLNAQNHVPQSGGRVNFNSHACNNVPNWSRSVDILKALNNAVPHNSSSHVDDRIAHADVRRTSSVRKPPMFDIYAVPGEDARDACDQNRDAVNQNSNPLLFYRGRPEEANSSCTCVPISLPRVSSWSFTKKSVATTPNAANQHAMNNMIKIQSADNIRRLQFINGSIPSTSGQLDLDRTVYPPNNNENSAIFRHQTVTQEAICHQPRENKSVAQIPMPSNKGHVHPNPAKQSVVHWTNSVENRVCCPETVLYGAVYGLKCLK